MDTLGYWDCYGISAALLHSITAVRFTPGLTVGSAASDPPRLTRPPKWAIRPLRALDTSDIINRLSDLIPPPGSGVATRLRADASHRRNIRRWETSPQNACVSRLETTCPGCLPVLIKRDSMKPARPEKVGD